MVKNNTTIGIHPISQIKRYFYAAIVAHGKS